MLIMIASFSLLLAKEEGFDRRVLSYAHGCLVYTEIMRCIRKAE